MPSRATFVLAEKNHYTVTTPKDYIGEFLRGTANIS